MTKMDLTKLQPMFLPGGGLTVAMDHGLDGVPRGFERVAEVIEGVLASDPDAVIVTAGIAQAWGTKFAEAGIAMIGATDAAISEDGNVVGKSAVATARAFAELGCVATKVVFQLGWSGRDYCEEVSRIAGLVEESHLAGLPCVVEPNVIGGDGRYEASARQRAIDGCRTSSELGADVLKMPLLDSDGVRAAVATSHCPVTVMGGAATDVETFLEDVRGSLAGGAVGIVAGRNVWQGGETEKMVRALREVLGGRASAA